MRPMGDVAQAMARAAMQPGTVVQLAHRAQVGESVARYTASRMVDRQQLVVVQQGRPAVLAAPGAAPAGTVAGRAPAPKPHADAELARTLNWLTRSFWESDRSAPP
jgi:hypothetical protein